MSSLSNFFDIVLFLLSSLVPGPGFMSISPISRIRFSFTRDWPEIRKSGIPLSEFCPIFGDWCELGILNLALMSLIKCYWTLLNPRVTALTVSELLRKNQQAAEECRKITPPPFPDPDLGKKFLQSIWSKSPNKSSSLLYKPKQSNLHWPSSNKLP